MQVGEKMGVPLDHTMDESETVVEEVKTEEVKKELIIIPVNRTSLYSIKWRGGGQVPDVLTGKYTSPKLAHDDIEKYMVERDSATRV